MEVHPTPFPVRSKYMKPKSVRQISEAAPKPDFKVVPLHHKQKRVFGTARNPNVPLNPISTKKPIKVKASSVPLEKSTKPPETTQSDERKKKTVCFQQPDTTKDGKFSPQTPVQPPGDILTRPRFSTTPYRSAERCSKCRFDRLESSAHWLGQIKLAESVGKHFVSAAFFHLALDCKAEPFRSIRAELKKYLVRHEYLNAEREWTNLLISYGVVEKKEESRTGLIEGSALVQCDQQETDKQKEEN